MPVMQRASLSYVDDAELVISTDVDLPAEINEVFAVIADNTSWSEWFKDCSHVEASHNPWTAAGQRRTITVASTPKPLEITEVAVAIEPPHLWAMQFARANLPIAKRGLEILELSDTSRAGETRTQVRWTGAFDLPIALKPFSGVAEQLFLRTWGESLEALLDAVIARR